MTRKENTQLLKEILINTRLSDRKYYAEEVTLDYGTSHPKRVDVMEFIPKGVIRSSDIEKGIFVCYEIKSCKEDVYSGHGINFFGEKNYFVMSMQTYKDIMHDDHLSEFIKKNFQESSLNYGFLVAVPASMDLRNTHDLYAFFDHPAPFEGPAKNWKLHTIVPCREGWRTRSLPEMMFCMLRSKGNN